MRTYPLRAPFNATGIPYGPRTSDTGNPTTGVGQFSTITLSGTPQPIHTEAYECTVTGTPEALDVARLSLDGTDYDYTVLALDTPTDVAAGIVALCVADPNYTVTNVGPVVTVESQTPGPWVGSVTTLYTPIAAGDGAFTTVNTSTGYAANTFAVDDGVFGPYSYTVLAGNTLADCATALAALINADYSSSAIGPVISVTGAPGVPFTFTDVSVNNSGPGGIATYALVSLPEATVTINSPFVMSLSGVHDIALWCDLQAGTSCVVTPWFYDNLAGVWAAQAPVVVNADKVIQLAVPAINSLFVEQGTFVGGGVVEVTCVGNRIQPGYL